VVVWTVSTLLSTAARYLEGHGSSSPRLDAELLLAEVLQEDRLALYVDHDRPLAEAEVAGFRELIRRRAHAEPVAYILGRAYFRYQQLKVTPAVLIPRPETEELVDRAFEWLDIHPLELCVEPGGTGGPDVPCGGTPLVADVGVGSGAIALSLAAERGLSVLGVEADAEALGVARDNRARLGLEKAVELRQGDLLRGIPPGSLRLVVSNPPYVSDEEMPALAPEVRDHEPRAALRGGPDGLTVIRRLLPQALKALSPGGRLLLEVGAVQARAVVSLGLEVGFCCPDIFLDLSGRERMVGLSRPGAPWVAAEDAVDSTRLDTLRRALRAGAIVGIPTDTVYGLACTWDSNRGVRRLLAAKGRGAAKPVAVLFSSTSAVRTCLPDLPAAVLTVLDEFLPGPFTFVVPTTVSRPELVGTEDSVGVLVPDAPDLLGFLDRLGLPLAATSANHAGQPDAAGPADVPRDLAAACAILVISGRGEGAVGTPSTVVDLRTLARDGRWQVLREGAVAADALALRMERLGY